MPELFEELRGKSLLAETPGGLVLIYVLEMNMGRRFSQMGGSMALVLLFHAFG